MTPRERMRGLLQADWGMPILIAACIFLLPFGRTVELPMAIMAITGLVMTLRQPLCMIRTPPVRLLFALFACLWLPMLLSLPDAVDFSRGLSTDLAFLRFLFMGLFMLYALQNPERMGRIISILGVVLAFWAVDGLLQAVWGANLFGSPPISGQVTGVFHPSQNIGQVLAVLAPVFLLWLVDQAKRRHWLWLLAPAYMAVILLSGKRSAWVMLAVGLGVLGIVTLARSSRRRRLALVGLAGAALLAGGLALSQHAGFRAKVETTAGMFSDDFEKADLATSYRMTIWRVGLDIYREHWINGIGPRGFRMLYPKYAQPGDMFMEADPESGPTHPHQMTLEVAVETGALGLVGFGLLWAWLLRALWQAARWRDDPSLAWLTALALAILPINTGHALYGSFWSGIVFWLLIMALASRRTPPASSSVATAPHP